MDNKAFFFQKDLLLLKDITPGFIADPEISLAYNDSFPLKDSFSIPSLDGKTAISCVVASPEASLPPELHSIPVRQAFSMISNGVTERDNPASSLLRAFHIAQWRNDSQYCGSCGNRNTDAPAELARLCPVCGRLEYPRIAPAIITVIVNDEGKILLAHNIKFAPGMYSLIAGFAEAGESLESTVIREIREEVAIEIRDIRYVVSQPWPFPNSLMVGFSAHHASGTIKPDGIEIEDARWFSRDDLPKMPGPGSVSRYLIDRWYDGTLE